jgi:branched-chain amino acid transport system ATP-binding protein
MPLLEVRKLTMRFGGLTAVSNVDLDVPKDAIFSVIGPNGAGKTTLFNAITGIYEPTAGTIRCGGRELRQRFSLRVALFCIGIGILTSLAALLLSVDINQLWRATITRNMQDPETPFSSAAAWSDFRSYLSGRLGTERWKGKRWAVVPWNASRPILGLADQRDDARELAGLLDKVAAGDTSLDLLPDPGSRWEVIADKPTLDDVARSRASQLRIEWIAAILGFVLASAGSYAIWTRSRRTPDVIASNGIARTFQNIRLLASMTVLENVQVAIDRRLGRGVRQWVIFAVVWLAFAGGLAWGLLPAVWPARPSALNAATTIVVLLVEVGLLARAQWRKRGDERESARLAFDILGVVGLHSRASSLAGSLAYGQQRRLEIARALALQPRLLLLDEPAAGMNPTESADLIRLIRGIRDRGVTVLLIEHHMSVVMGISDRIAVLDHGLKIAEGTPAEVRANPCVIAAYLGQEEAN